MMRSKIHFLLFFLLLAGIQVPVCAQDNLSFYRESIARIRKGGDTAAVLKALKDREDMHQKGDSAAYPLALVLYAETGYWAGSTKEARLKEAVEIAAKEKNGLVLGYCQAALGLYYYRKDNAVPALGWLNQALSLLPDDPKDVELEEVQWAVALINSYLSNYKESLIHDYWLAKTYTFRGDSLALSGAWNTTGITQMNLGKFDSAAIYFSKSLALREKLGAKAQVGQSYNNTGTLFFKQGRYGEALVNFEKGLRLRQDGHAPASGVIESIINIGKAHYKLNHIPEATQWLEKGERMAREMSRGELQRRALEDLKEIYRQQGDYKKAYEAQATFYLIRDTLYGLQKREDVLRLSYLQHVREDSIARAQTEALYRMQREQESAIAAEKEKRTLVFGIALTAGMLLLAAISIILLRNNRRRKQDNETISGQRDELAEQQKEIGQSISYARRIQDAMLPSSLLLEKVSPEHFIFFRPRDVVSGDFYWAAEQEDCFFVAAADCTGHGVPGALMSMIGINLLNQLVKEKQLSDPGLILLELHKSMLNAFSGQQGQQTVKDGMDIALLRIDRKTGTAAFAGAARPLLYRSHGQLHEIKGDRFSIGGVKDDDQPYVTSTIQLQGKTSFYIFSDGFSDQFGGDKGKKFMYKNLREKIDLLGELEMPQQGVELENTFKYWKGTQMQVDDVTVIGLQINL